MVRKAIGLFKLTTSVSRVAQAMAQDKDYHKVGSLNTHTAVHVVLVPAERLEEFSNLVESYMESIREPDSPVKQYDALELVNISATTLKAFFMRMMNERMRTCVLPISPQCHAHVSLLFDVDISMEVAQYLQKKTAEAIAKRNNQAHFNGALDS